MLLNARFNILKVFLFVIFSLCQLVMASNQEAISNLILQSQNKSLSEDPYWHALVHYEKPPFGLGPLQSAIRTDRFFLAADGKKNPQHELEETLRSFFNDATTEPDEHPQCRFVSRYEWLRRRLNWSNIDIKNQSCPGYKLWSFNGHIQSISLLFATGYLSNPASFFGHPLLKFNLPRTLNSSDLLDTSINYGALTPKHENPFVYAMKGLFGGYDAGMTHVHFFYNSHNYSETELRDMWEYELNFSSDQVEQIVSHTWELLGAKFSYFFLSDNCASRMAQLLEAVTEQQLLPRHVPYAIPYTVFDSLAYGHFANGKPLVKNVSLIPSRQNRLNVKYFSLTPPELNSVDLYIKSAAPLAQTKYPELSDSSKIKVIETLFDYAAFRLIKDETNEEFKQMKKNLLRERLRLPAEEKAAEITPLESAPHYGQRPVLTRASYLNSEKFGSGLEVRVRPAYYDFLSSDIGRLPYSALGIFDLTLNYLDQHLFLKEFNFIAIETLNPSLTGLPGDGGFAWKFKIGADNQDLGCTACTVARLEGGLGQALPLTPSLLLYGLVDGRVQSAIEGSGTLAVTPTLAALIHFSESWSTHLSAAVRYYLNGSRTSEPVIQVENRFGQYRNWDLRLGYYYHVDHQTKFSYSYFW